MQPLWTKESNIDGALYVDIFKNMHFEYTDDEIAERANALKSLVLPENQKSNVISLNYRNEGNKEFKKKKYIHALNLYNSSLCFAETVSDNISIAYANRSACFFYLKLYKECITDIEHALNADYPCELLNKILQRKQDCYDEMQTGFRNSGYYPEADFQTDYNFSSMSNMLEVKRNEEYGRHITATCYINVGETVLIEENFLTTEGIKDRRMCSHCLKYVTNLIPCDGCTNTMFCNNTCRKSDIFHKLECKTQFYEDYIRTPTKDMQTSTFILLRSIWLALNMFSSVDGLMEFVDKVLAQKCVHHIPPIYDPKSKYLSFLKLNIYRTYGDDLPKKIHQLYGYVTMFAAIAEKFDTLKKQRFLMHLIGHHACVILNNVFEGKESAKSVFVNKAYFNHSCSPNVVNIMHWNRAICITSRPIYPGEQLFISYFEASGNTQYRKKFLEENYGFCCNCERCEPFSLSIHKILGNAEDLKLSLTVFECTLSNLTENPHPAKSDIIRVKQICTEFLNTYGRNHCDKIGKVLWTYAITLKQESKFITNVYSILDYI